MKAVSYLFVGLLTLQVYGLAPASAKTLSGEYRLDNKNILISETQKYRGQFDLRSKLPLGDDFVLTKIIISFKFQDDLGKIILIAYPAGRDRLTINR